MKAKPCKLVPGSGYVECPVEEATHVTLNIPGPVGLLTLPVQIKGRREGTGNWTWNGSAESPTLRPSVKTTGHAYNGKDPHDKANWQPYVCHSWIGDGRIQFLDDTTHELKGQTVDLLEVGE